MNKLLPVCRGQVDKDLTYYGQNAATPGGLPYSEFQFRWLDNQEKFFKKLHARVQSALSANYQQMQELASCVRRGPCTPEKHEKAQRVLEQVQDLMSDYRFYSGAARYTEVLFKGIEGLDYRKAKILAVSNWSNVSMPKQDQLTDLEIKLIEAAVRKDLEVLKKDFQGKSITQRQQELLARSEQVKAYYREQAENVIMSLPILRVLTAIQPTDAQVADALEMFAHKSQELQKDLLSRYSNGIRDYAPQSTELLTRFPMQSAEVLKENFEYCSLAKAYIQQAHRIESFKAFLIMSFYAGMGFAGSVLGVPAASLAMQIMTPINTARNIYLNTSNWLDAEDRYQASLMVDQPLIKEEQVMEARHKFASQVVFLAMGVYYSYGAVKNLANASALISANQTAAAVPHSGRVLQFGAGQVYEKGRAEMIKALVNNHLTRETLSHLLIELALENSMKLRPLFYHDFRKLVGSLETSLP